jgi:hypothetical protein
MVYNELQHGWTLDFAGNSETDLDSSIKKAQLIERCSGI